MPSTRRTQDRGRVAHKAAGAVRRTGHAEVAALGVDADGNRSGEERGVGGADLEAPRVPDRRDPAALPCRGHTGTGSLWRPHTSLANAEPYAGSTGATGVQLRATAIMCASLLPDARNCPLVLPTWKFPR